jgi:hypothetical protein
MPAIEADGVLVQTASPTLQNWDQQQNSLGRPRWISLTLGEIYPDDVVAKPVAEVPSQRGW